MKVRAFVTAAAVAVALGTGSANSCTILMALDFNFIRYADLVVVGTIHDYPVTSKPMSRYYGKFQVEVSEVLYGETSKSFPAIWYNYTYPYPTDLPAEPMILAFTTSQSPHAATRDLDLTPEESKKLVVLQDSCSAPFMFPVTSFYADEAREALKRRR